MKGSVKAKGHRAAVTNCYGVFIGPNRCLPLRLTYIARLVNVTTMALNPSPSGETFRNC